MDWTSNSVIFITLRELPSTNKTEKCSYCKTGCSCETRTLEEFTDIVNKVYAKKYQYYNVHYKNNKSYLNIPYCSCLKCIKTELPCINVITIAYNRNKLESEVNCLYHNNKGKCTCVDSMDTYVFGVYYISNKELEKSNLDDVVFQMAFFHISKTEYDKLKLGYSSFGDIINWLYENVPIFLQTSIYSTINIYDNTFCSHSKEIKSYFNNCRKVYNDNFRGYAREQDYATKIENLLTKYSDPETYKIPETKINPHVARNKKTPKLKK